MNPSEIIYKIGIPEKYKLDAVNLYDEAFGEKFSHAIKSSEDRKQLFNKGFVLEYAVGAISGEKLLGVAGFQTTDGSLASAIHYGDLLSQLGFIKGTWAAFVFSLYERKPKPGELVMDGIAVSSDARGRGVGSALLDKIRHYAVQHAYSCIRLDVIDSNSRAKKLYERMGFEAVKTDNFPYLKRVLGFSGVTTMELGV